MRSVLFAMLVACGGKSAQPAGPPAASGQDVTDAVSRLCATPMRAQADLDYSSADPAAKAATLTKHMSDGITNRHVLDTIHGWSDKSAEQKSAELSKLTHEGGLSSKCRLLELWAEK